MGWSGILGGDGNVGDDPTFVDPVGNDDVAGTIDDDLRLGAGSPCIDTGNNYAVPDGIITDLDGAARFFDDPFSPDGGNGTAPIVDMGPYEFAGADCNNNGIPDHVEVLAGSSEDCTGNGIPDECEPDCNDNGNADSCDILDGISTDENGNGVPDECEPPILYVDAAATGLNTGMTWTDAFTKLHDALALAHDSAGGVREIWVASGTYKPIDDYSTDRNATFQLVSGVGVYGGFSGGETSRDQRNPSPSTFLSGDIFDNDQAPPVGFGDNCRHVVTGNGTDASAILDGFIITGSRADGSSSMISDGGGGMVNIGGSPTVQNCIFYRNWAYYGAGMLNHSNANPTIVNCRFIGNYAFRDGSGVCNAYHSYPTLLNCSFNGNYASWRGGGLHNYDCGGAGLTLRNCTFAGNSSSEDGAGMHSSDESIAPAIVNCVFWGNVSGTETGETAQIFGGTPTVNYTYIEGLTGDLGGIGNSGADPLLDNPLGGDGVAGTGDENLGLSHNSPCIDAGDNTAWTPPLSRLTDAMGKPRFVDIFAVPDTGNGSAPIVDIGAFEHWLDCNGNGIVDGQDIAGGTSEDWNSNLVPDECEALLDVPLTAPFPHDVLKNRYVSFAPSNGNLFVAYRLGLTASTYFPQAEGVLGWVGEPDDNKVARVVPEAVHRIWTEPVIHLGDCRIVPVATYEISATFDELAFSEPLLVETIARPGTNFWADAVGTLTYFCDGDRRNAVCDPENNECPLGQSCEPAWLPPDGVTNFNDVTAAVFAFQTVPGTVWPDITWVDLHGDDFGDANVDPPNYVVNFSDIQQIVLAFGGAAYPYSNPADCP